MTPTTVIQSAVGTLLGADTTTLAEATPFVEVHLIKSPFTPAPTLVIGDLTLADFDGYAPLHAASAATQVFIDPATGDQIVQVREPAGGWHWATTGITNLPQTIHGFALTKADGSILYGAELLSPVVILNGSGQGLDVDQVHFRIPNGSIV